VETLAIIPDLIVNGGAWLRRWGTEESPGVKLFCLSGHVNRPGVVEAPFGITVRELIDRYGGGFQGAPQAILLGGAAGGLLHPDYFDTPLTNEALEPLGLPIGSGVVMVFNQDVNLLKVLKSVAAFFAHETCGHCLPCRVGTNQVHKLLDKIAVGDGAPKDVEKLERLSVTMRDMGLCGLGRTAPSPVLSSLRYFRSTYDSLIQNDNQAGDE
jgi:NADH:ubiquinone oxidoreductase subunit F (NADH-binding)